MRIIISPAKKMKIDTDSLEHTALPQFLPEAKRLRAALRQLDYAQAKALWGCNDQIAAQNFDRLARLSPDRALTPAILSYEGIQYQTMAPGVFEERQFDYISQHLRILSGFYGLLRPFDGVIPYRLEMQARLSVEGCKDLYAFWGDMLARQLCAETDLILDLASKEYSRAVTTHLPSSVRRVVCVFGEWRGGIILEKGTHCKMARGAMVRYLAERQVSKIEQVEGFCGLGYAFSEKNSTENQLVFLREVAAKRGEAPPFSLE